MTYAIYSVLEYALMRSSRMTGSKAAFHSTWDVNLSEILRIILRDGEDFRGSNLESDADLQIPDYGFLVKNSCLFEERKQLQDQRRTRGSNY
jgi:hypothetical protein